MRVDVKKQEEEESSQLISAVPVSIPDLCYPCILSTATLSDGIILTLTHRTLSCLDVDIVDNITQRCGSFLHLLHFIRFKFLVEDGIDSILTDNHRQTQEHLLLYTMIALDNQPIT